MGKKWKPELSGLQLVTLANIAREPGKQVQEYIPYGYSLNSGYYLHRTLKAKGYVVHNVQTGCRVTNKGMQEIARFRRALEVVDVRAD